MRLVSCVCRIALFVVLVSPPLRAQHGGAAVTATGQVSAVAIVSAGPDARVVEGDARVSSESAGAQGLILSLSGARAGATQIEIPIQLRSNSDFALIASCTTKGATLSALSVVEVGGAGAFVYPGAAGRVKVPAAFDGRSDAEAPPGGKLEIPLPATVLTGPPISTGGTPDSPGNMIEVVLRVVLAAPDEKGWEARLKLSTAPPSEARPESFEQRGGAKGDVKSSKPSGRVQESIRVRRPSLLLNTSIDALPPRYARQNNSAVSRVLEA